MARPRKDQALDIRAGAVEAAIALLESGGAEGLTMSRVAAAVGCRAPALYNHYRNKADLLRAVQEAGFERLYAGKLAVAARSGGDALARLREGGLAYLRFALENPALYGLMFAPPSAGDRAADPFAADPGMKSMGFLRQSITACQAEGYLPGQDPELVTFTLWSCVHGAASLLLQGRIPAATKDREALCIATVDTVMQLIGTTHDAAAAD